MTLPADPALRPHRTLFLSDMHLGTAGARADLALAFLKANRAETYVLVGDILDFWQGENCHWGPAEQRVVDHLHARVRDGAAVISVRGNHDPQPDSISGVRALPGERVECFVHETADGRRFYVTHGDEEDHGPFQLDWLQRAGSAMDQVLRRLDRRVAGAALNLGIGRGFGIVPRLVGALNQTMYHHGAHEKRLLSHVRALGVDGVICGHYHLPKLVSHEGRTYANCGDWLDNFTGLSESPAGELRVLRAEPLPAAARALRRRLHRAGATAPT